nr:homoserine kinase [Tanacetum cinerariifolium]
MKNRVLLLRNEGFQGFIVLNVGLRQAYALMAAVLQGDCVGLGKTMSSDKIVELRRMPSIPGMEDVKKVTIKAGAFGCTISGAGATAVSITDDEEKWKEIEEKMEAFMVGGNLKASASVKKLDRVGAQLVSCVSR